MVSEYSLQEIRQHNTNDDCWIVIEDKVYDVTEFGKRHPGGSMIFMGGGLDNSAMFRASHPSSVYDMLPKMCIGRVKSTEKGIRYGKTTDFYATLQRRVRQHITNIHGGVRDSPAFYVKALYVVSVVLIGYYAVWFGTEGWWRYVAAAFLGTAWGQVGFNLMHDGCHGGASNNSRVNRAIGYCMDLVGVSSYFWIQQHSVGHHQYTNIEKQDPDIRVSESDMRRVARWQPHHSWHVFQHGYLLSLYGLLGFKAIYVDDLKMFSEGRIGSVTFSMPKSERIAFWIGKALYLIMNFAVPLYFNILPFGEWVKLYCFALMVFGYNMSFVFQIAHVVSEADFFQPDANGTIDADWGEAQVVSSLNFSIYSDFWHFFSGGLNLQVEHHLFPTISHVHYDLIRPILQYTCKEFGLPYKAFPTFLSGLGAHVAHLKRIGAASTFKEALNMRME